MASTRNSEAADPEIAAITIVHKALAELDVAAQKRVLNYVAGKLGVASPVHEEKSRVESPKDIQESEPDPASSPQDIEDTEGISPVALKWMKRSGLNAEALSSLFSLGVDEIDLVVDAVPGNNKKERMHSVLLLKGIAAYLGSGAARVSHEQVKEACLHYDAFDNKNFATYLKSFAPDVSGTKESGYTLTPRGLTAATKIIKAITESR